MTYKHKAKKSLGQNFLKSGAILSKIVVSAELKESDIVLEIGPGKGALTEKLLEKVKKVIAIEKDDSLFAFLEEKFAKNIENGQLILINQDILEFDLKNNLKDSKNYKIVANIPYNITGAILKKFLTSENQPETMTLLVQKEVAQRIVANDKKESLLSISVKSYGEPKVLFKVQARFFSPAPKVDSAVIHIKDISKRVFETKNIKEEDFWKVLRAGFAQKRKKLSNNLKKVVNKEILEGYKDQRAEDLSVNDWIKLTIGNKDF